MTTRGTRHPKTDPTAAVRDALAAHGFPSAPGPGLGFTRDDDALFERGYPHLRFVTDEPVDGADALAIAEQALDAIDPVLRIRVPRAVAEAPRPPTQQEHEAEIERIFGELGAALRGTNDRDAQVQAIRDAYERYTEARAAIGDPTPEAYFTHCFGDFGLGEWAMLAVGSID